jgi:hypothetical protein
MIITRGLKRLSYNLYGWNMDEYVEGFGGMREKRYS